MTLQETKIVIKSSKSGSEIAKAMIDHFKSQAYYRVKVPKIDPVDDLLKIFDGGLPLNEAN